VNSAIFVPMQIEGETIGVMQVQSYRLEGYTQEDIDLLAALANVAAVALHRVRAEEAVQRERDFAESLIETAQAIVLVLDTAGRILRFNPYMEEVSGYRLEEVQGQDWLATFLPERDETAMRELFRQVVSGIQMRGNVYPIVTRDGRERQIEWHGKTLEDAGGNVVGLLAIGQDITERVKAEEALRESRDAVRELFQRLETAIEEERSRVARELHDDTLQRLMTVIWVLDPKEVGLEKVQAISQAVNEVADSIRRVVSSQYLGVVSG
jgi:PAS domain S-box-containing protein